MIGDRILKSFSHQVGKYLCYALCVSGEMVDVNQTFVTSQQISHMMTVCKSITHWL